MTLPEQDPISKRRIRGTKFYVLRNFYALGIMGGFTLLSVPVVYFSNFFKNCEAAAKSMKSKEEFLEKKKFHMNHHLAPSSKDKAQTAFKFGVEGTEYADLSKHDHILKGDKPGVDDL